MIVDPETVREFLDSASFRDWLARNHAAETEVWIKIHKVGSGLKSISPLQAIDEALCWGWIDGIKKSFDSKSFLQRYTPRGKKSIWSQINVNNVARLAAEGRMTVQGMKHVEAAKADGRWERAYTSGSELKIPGDLLDAVNADPMARETFESLSAQNRFAFAFRIHNVKTDAGRKKAVAKFAAMLGRGETIYPQKKK